MTAKVQVVCNECGHRWKVAPDSDPQCKRCNSVDFEVVEAPAKRAAKAA